MNETVKIPYGSGVMECAVAGPLLFSGELRGRPALSDLREATRDALREPIGTAPLSELARGASRVVILIDDNTRNTPVGELLPVLLECLNDAGVNDESVELLVATGTHSPMTDRQIAGRIGREMASRLRFFCHDVSDRCSLRRLGTVRTADMEIPVEVNRRVIGADLLIGLGQIVPHPDAGYSGGAKIVQPGVCGYHTTAATHILSGLQPVIPLGNVRTRARIAMEAVARMVGLSFIVNVVPNASDGVTAVVAGDFIRAHFRGVKIARENFRVRISRPADVVLAGACPCEEDFWQASKALVAASFGVRPGGIIILAAPCPEGLAPAHPGLGKWLHMTCKELSEAACAEVMSPDFDFVAADIALNIARVRERTRVFIVSDGLGEEDVRKLGFTRFKTLAAAVSGAMKEIPGAHFGCLPTAGVSMPCVERSGRVIR